MTTGWQRQYAAAVRQARQAGDEYRLEKDIAAGKVAGWSLLQLQAEYWLSKRKIKQIIQDGQQKGGEA